MAGRPTGNKPASPSNFSNMTLKTATFMKEDARVTDAEEARLQKAMSRGGRVGGVGAGRDSSPALNKPATGGAPSPASTTPATRTTGQPGRASPPVNKPAAITGTNSATPAPNPTPQAGATSSPSVQRPTANKAIPKREMENATLCTRTWSGPNQEVEDAEEARLARIMGRGKK